MNRMIRTVSIASVRSCAHRCRRARRSRRSRRPTSRRPLTPPTRSTRACRKARTPTTSRRSPRSIPNLFGIAVVTPDGKVYTAGDINTEVSIQSISKVFTMAQVIQEQGLDAIEKRIGVDATGARFNSIIAVEAVEDRRRHRCARDEPARQPGRDLRDQHGEGRERRRGVGEDHRLPQRLPRAAS